MKMVKCLEQHKLIEKGVDALYKALGPVEARRFIALAQPRMKKEDSVQRHRRYEASLNEEEFLAEMEKAHYKACKKK